MFYFTVGLPLSISHLVSTLCLGGIVALIPSAFEASPPSETPHSLRSILASRSLVHSVLCLLSIVGWQFGRQRLSHVFPWFYHCLASFSFPGRVVLAFRSIFIQRSYGTYMRLSFDRYESRSLLQESGLRVEGSKSSGKRFHCSYNALQISRCAFDSPCFCKTCLQAFL